MWLTDDYDYNKIDRIAVNARLCGQMENTHIGSKTDRQTDIFVFSLSLPLQAIIDFVSNVIHILLKMSIF